ncbi:MAG: hypothetical protein KGR98_11245, partial [Verrucomicrobia bacterium]|nr:hypothetical protein [Verrucomicrobiota bacterium]
MKLWGFRQRDGVLECGGRDTALERRCRHQEIGTRQSPVTLRLPPHSRAWREPGRFTKSEMKSEVSGPVEQTNRAEDAVLEL